MFDDELNSLWSLLGLLEPSEYFITVDNSAMWHKHISWAKSKGEDLRSHITQRYASSMVFLSCLLAAQINVFFNSSKEITEMRACLATQRMFTLKYWIGVVIMSDICVTILALVNTYTLSKLIASISDSNAHAMLRSSIGSYVAVLPSRFTVAALYLFLGWIAMFIWDIFTGPIHFFFLLMVLLMFFHVIIPLSAFGRLIIHTGAMGRRPVLDVELEKELLPSGLHNSLLIRATDRKRKYSSATDQYRKTANHRQSSSRHHPAAGATSSVPSSTLYGTSSHIAAATAASSHRPPRNITFGGPHHTDSDDLTLEGEDDDNRSDDSGDSADHHHQQRFGGGGGGGETPGSSDRHSEMGGSNMDPESLVRGGGGGGGGGGYHGGQYYAPSRGHRRIQTMDTVGSDNFFFPGAAILNATTSTKDIHDIVQHSMYLSASGADGTSTANGSSTFYSGGHSMASISGDVPSQSPYPIVANHHQAPPDSRTPILNNPEQHQQSSSSPLKEVHEIHEKNPENIVPVAKSSKNDDNDKKNNNDSSPADKRNNFPETINTPAGLTRNVSTSSGHRRQMSSGGGSPRLMLQLPPTSPSAVHSMDTPIENSLRLPNDQDSIHAGMRYPSPDLPSSSSRKFFATPPGVPPPATPPYPHNQQQQQLQQYSDPQRHPLLMSPTGAASSSSSSRPPTHRQMNKHSHRRRSSAARRSSGSFFGFIPLPSPAEEELDEDNAIRASMGMPLAPDLASQERLVEEQKHHDYGEESTMTRPEAVASTWLAMHQTPPAGGESDGNRRWSFSTGHIKRDTNEVQTTNSGGYRSNSRRNLMIVPLNSPHSDDGGGQQRSNNSNSRRNLMANESSGGYRSHSRRNLSRQGSDDQQQDRGYRPGSRRNLMATISSHPDEEKEAEEEERARRPSRIQHREASIPEETTRLLADQDKDVDDEWSLRRK